MIQSLERAFCLLELLDAAGTVGLGLTELAERAGLKASTTRNFLSSMVDLGYVRQDLGTRRYYLGARAQALGTREFKLEKLRAAAVPVVEALQEEVRETVLLACWDNGLRRTLVTAESDHALKVGATLSADTSFYTTATGRLLLGLITPAERGELIQQLGLPTAEVWPEAADPAALAEQLDACTRAGSCVYDRKGSHIMALATAVPLPTGGLRAALGLYYPSVRDQPGRRDKLLVRLQRAAERIQEAYQRS